MTRHTRSALLLVAGLASTACGPYLERHVQSRTAQEVSVRCTQGPLEFSLRTLGARWGEGFRLYACSPRDIQGRFRIVEEGTEDGDGTWGAHKTVRQWVAGTASGSGGSSQGSYQHVRVAVERPDNARCVASADELPGLAGTVAVTPIEPDGAVATGGAAGTDEQAAAPGGLVEVAAAPVALVPAAGFPAQLGTEPEYQCLSLAGKSFYHVAHRFWSNQDPGATATTPGRALAIRLWFIEPNDLEGVVFVLDQFVETPSCTDEEWIAHLQEERLEREAEQREREAEW